MLIVFRDSISARICAPYDFLFLFYNSDWAHIWTVVLNFCTLYTWSSSDFSDEFKWGRKIRFAVFLDEFCPIVFYACFELLTWIFFIQLSLWVGIQHYTLSGHSYKFLSKDFMQQEIYLSITTNITPQKRNGRNGVLKFFPQGLEEMHQEPCIASPRTRRQEVDILKWLRYEIDTGII